MHEAAIQLRLHLNITIDCLLRSHVQIFVSRASIEIKKDRWNWVLAQQFNSKAHIFTWTRRSMFDKPKKHDSCVRHIISFMSTQKSAKPWLLKLKISVEGLYHDKLVKMNGHWHLKGDQLSCIRKNEYKRYDKNAHY